MSDGASPYDKADLFEWIFENHPDGVLVVDSDNRVVARNRRLLELCQVPAPTASADDSPLGVPASTLGRLLSPGFSDHGGLGDEVETEAGRVLERRCAGLSGPGGRPNGCVWFFRDVTSRKAAEANLWVQIDELRRWQDVMLDRELRMVGLKREVNELCERLGDPARYPNQTPDADGEVGDRLTTTSELPRVPDIPGDPGCGRGR
jgi:hypothetical protein